MADHPPSWPRCACDRCFAAAARAVIGDALPALVASAFTLPATPAPAPPRKPRRKPARRRARPPVDHKPPPAPEVVQPKAEPPLVVAPQVDDVRPPEPVIRPRRGPGRPRKVPAVAPETLESFPASPETPAPPLDEAPADVAAEPERTCRVCGETEPASWAQADLCGSMTCIGVAARNGRDVAAAKRAPAAAKAKRLQRIARIVGRRDRLAAAAERAELGDDEEDLVERLDRVPEVDHA